ncbi:MAG TPA: hypothetical protein PKY25_01935 [Bacilli bacterium]|nr:hypothetical protein [Bacilli bacterium]
MNNLIYNHFNNLNINREIEKIKQADIVNIRVSTTDKGLLFLLGILFAAGKRINIINKEDSDFKKDLSLKENFDIKTNNKSFYIMSYVWEKLSDDTFPNKDFSNIKNDFNILIENIKRLGIKVEKIENNPISNKVFLICPVRDATATQVEEVGHYMDDINARGYKLYVPHIDTVQKDILGGYAICIQNARAIGESNIVHIYYDQNSKGSLFDLGIAYYMNKNIYVINEDKIVYNNDDFGDNIVRTWNEKLKQKSRIYSKQRKRT